MVQRLRFFGVVVIAVLMATVNAAPLLADWTSTIAGASPLHWFQFEETQGTTAIDSGSAAVSGTYTGGYTLGAAGLVGGAASFDGVNGHVAVNGPDLSGEWTLEAILLSADGGPSQGILGSSTMAIKADQWNKTGKLGYTRFGVVDVTLNAATPRDYTHLAFVGTGSGVSLYVDGSLTASDATTTALGRQVLAAGRINPDLTVVDPLKGSIDELVIYDRALSAAEITSHFSAVPEPSSLVLLLLGALPWMRRQYRRP